MTKFIIFSDSGESGIMPGDYRHWIRKSEKLTLKSGLLESHSTLILMILNCGCKYGRLEKNPDAEVSFSG